MSLPILILEKNKKTQMFKLLKFLKYKLELQMLLLLQNMRVKKLQLKMQNQQKLMQKYQNLKLKILNGRKEQ